MNTMFKNLRFAWRQMRRSPGFAITAILTLALGIGATTAIYTVVYATLLAPMPYPKPDQLVMVWSQFGHSTHNSVSGADYLDWKQQSTVFKDIVAFSATRFNMAGKQEPEMVDAQFSSPGMYNTMGVRFALGRDFLPEEGVAGKEHVAILANRLWKRLGADPNIIGKTVTLDQKPYTVVGVWASGQPDRLPWELNVPFVLKPDQINHDFHWFLVLGRLKDGVTLQQANANMKAVAAHIAQANPRSNKGWSAAVEPLQNDFLGENVKLTLWLLLGAVGFLLLIACANVANLLLSKGTSRQKEVAVRSAIGASRRDVFFQFMTESLMLAVTGGICGVGLGYAMLRGFIALLPRDALPSEADLRLNFPVLLVTLAATTIAGVLFGYAPAWYASRVDPAESLKEGGRAGYGSVRNRLRRSLIVGEFALALTLLSGAGLAIHSFWNLNHVDLGIRTDHILTFGLPMNQGMDYKSDQIIAYYQQIVRRIESEPGVESTSASTGMPLEGPGFGLAFSIAGQPDYADPSQRPTAGVSMVTPDYFKTFGVRLIKGRFFTDADNATSLHIAVVNEQFVRHYMPGKDPIGQTLKIPQIIPGEETLGPPQPWVIVGVSHDVRGGAFEEQDQEIDVPFYQNPWTRAGIGVRTAGDPAAMTKTVAAAVHAIDPTVALDHVETLNQIYEDDLSGDRFGLLLYASFAAIALLLATVGIYGVMAFAVGQRTHEIGVRMALGAGRGRVVIMVLREALVLACVGLAIGLGGAFLVGRAMQSMLYGIGSIDFAALAAVSAILLVSSLFASYIPARRASQVDPTHALRIE
jgi:putative ABC transport system permease protein